LLAEKEETSSKIYNVASGNDISINDLSESILEMNTGFGKSMEILYDDPRPGDIRYSSADISKIKMLGFAISGGSTIQEWLEWNFRNIQ